MGIESGPREPQQEVGKQSEIRVNVFGEQNTWKHISSDDMSPQEYVQQRERLLVALGERSLKELTDGLIQTSTEQDGFIRDFNNDIYRLYEEALQDKIKSHPRYAEQLESALSVFSSRVQSFIVTRDDVDEWGDRDKRRHDKDVAYLQQEMEESKNKLIERVLLVDSNLGELIDGITHAIESNDKSELLRLYAKVTGEKAEDEAFDDRISYKVDTLISDLTDAAVECADSIDQEDDRNIAATRAKVKNLKEQISKNLKSN